MHELLAVEASNRRLWVALVGLAALLILTIGGIFGGEHQSTPLSPL